MRPQARPLALALALAASGALLLSAPLARAQDTVEQAKAFFNAGAKLYDAGNFAAAVQAFDEAYRLAPRPALLFSIAQAEKRQYFVDRRVDTLRRAMAHYRQYLEAVQQGGRRADAAQSLSELELLAAKVDAQPSSSQAAPPPPPPPPASSRPRLSVMSTQTGGAQIWVDGKEATEGIFSEEVEPGKHSIRVTAPGYFDEQREVVVQKAPIALDVSLREKPARLTFDAPPGAQISVDGRLVGVTPLPVPLDLPAGAHVVTVAKNGHEPVSTEVDLERGEERQLSAPLARTRQRVASYVLLGTAAASVVAGGVFVGVALSKQSTAERIDGDRQKGNISQDDLDRYNKALDARDHLWKPAAGIAFGAGAALGAVGALLYAFDQPSAGAPTKQERRRPDAPTKPTGSGLEVSAAPVLGGGLLGAALSGSF